MDIKSYIAMLESYVKVREPDYSRPHKKGGDSGFHHNRNGEKVYWRKDEVKILFLDMDGVLFDFDSNLKEIVWNPPEMFEKFFFLNLPVNPGAKEFVEWVMKQPYLDVYIASKPILDGDIFWSATEKMRSVKREFPSLIQKMNLICDKALLLGDILVDDDASRWKDRFKGEFFHFDKKNTADSFKKLREYLEGSKP